MEEELSEFKARQRKVWTTGDYSEVAKIIEPVAALLVERARVASGQEVLDVATGTGNVALLAARAGARVVGLDLTPVRLEEARRRAEVERVRVEWIEGDAEGLPVENDRFDRVLSTFGVQFAPRHGVAAKELARVCRPGGTIGLCNWTPEGSVGRLIQLLASYSPPLPPFASPPSLWGSAEHIRRLFEGTGIRLEIERITLETEFESVEEYVRHMEVNAGPVVSARKRLLPEGRWEALRREMVSLISSFNQVSDEAASQSAGGRLRLPQEYLLVLGRKNG